MAAFSLACFFASDNCAFANPQKSGLKYYPAKSAAEPSGCLPANLPTGAREFEVLQPAPKSGVVVNAADFGLNENVENAATIINRAVAHCAKIGAAKLVVDRGTYKCFDAVSITLENFEDFTLDFSGSKLVYYSKCLKSENPNPAWNTKKKRKQLQSENKKLPPPESLQRSIRLGLGKGSARRLCKSSGEKCGRPKTVCRSSILAV